jgi:hypothetical protein
MLKDGQIKKQLLLPLIKENKIKKIVSEGMNSNNFEDALYKF